MILFKASSKSSIYARLLFSVAVLCLLSTVTGCSDDEDPAEIIPDPGSEIYFTKSLDFTSNSGESILSFTTNKDWTIEVSQSGGDVSWCTVFPSKGKAGENEVLVKVAENTGTDDRNATLILTAKELTNRIVVTQKQKDAITLTTAKFEVDKNGGDIEVEVKANVSYEVIIPEQYQSWIHKRTIRPDKCVFGIDKSEEYDKREGEIVFQSGDLKETLKVYQTGGGVLLLSKNEYTVSDKGDQIAVELKSNFDFEMKMPQVDWITTTVTRSVSSHTLYYTIAPNDTYDKREAEIIYYDRTNKSLADTLKIVQVQKDAILLSQKEYSVGCNEEFIYVEVNTNVDFTIQIPNSCASWINMVDSPTSRGLVSHKISFKISENATDKERVGEIVVSDKKGSLSEKIIVKQAEATAIVLSEKMYRFSEEGGRMVVKLSANTEFGVKMPQVDWIVASTTRTLSNYELYYTVTANHDYNSRKAEIIYYTKIGSVADTLKIVQAGRSAQDDVWDGSIATSYYTLGRGTEEEPYVITRCSEVAKLAREVKEGHTFRGVSFRIAANLDFNNFSFLPIGSLDKPFSAILNGSGKIIRGLNIKGDGYLGLLGYTEQATIQDLTISNSSISGTKYIGTFVGYAISTVIDNCFSDVAITSGSYIGGIVGYAKDSKISNCGHREQTIGNEHSSHIGGLVGQTENTRIINSFNRGTIFGGDCVGGLVGYSGVGSKIQNCYNKASFPRFYYADSVGGIVGYNCGRIENCYSTGVMSGNTLNGDMGMVMSGGIVGYNHMNTYLYCCYFLKQIPINKMFSFCGDLNWGTCIKCGSFDGSGVLERGLSMSYDNYLRNSLNYWVWGQSDQEVYKEWDTSMGWPDFVD